MKLFQPRCATVILLFATGLAVPLRAGQPEEIDFSEDIAPILQQRCIKCHGPDNREGGLRLDDRRSALQGGDSGPSIIAGKPKASYLWERISAEDPDERMPPEGPALSDRELASIRQWIQQGAHWPKSTSETVVRSNHWAFIPPVQPSLPAVRNKDKIRNPIDHFVQSRLEQSGFSLSPQASRYELIRRLYVDLIGLLPTPEEADAFVNDPRPDAYARLVDRLLASPHYGERWARRWLDLARYADTNGYEKDRERSIWPYRDWVINVLNVNMPFDQFTIEQLAGDLLPSPTLEQRIATGFHRNTMINEEGGIDVEEYRFHSIVDRAGTTGTVWLGLTVACAQCHTHKYDPITQREYYQLFAFFNNCDEPELKLPDPQVTQIRQQLEKQIGEIEDDMLARFPDLVQNGEFDAWLEEKRAKASDWKILRPELVQSEQNATMTVLHDGSVLASGDIPNYDSYHIELAPKGKVTALRLEVLPHESLPNNGPGRAVFDSGAGKKGDFLLGEFEVRIQGDNESAVKLAIEKADHSHALKKRSAKLAIDGNLDTGWSIGSRSGQAHQAVFQLKEPVHLRAGERLKVTLAQRYIHQMTIGRFRLSVTADDMAVPSSGLDADTEKALLTTTSEQTPHQVRQLRDSFLDETPSFAKERQQISKLKASMPEYPTTMVMAQRPEQAGRITRIHHRGEFLSPKDAVEPGFPAVIAPTSTFGSDRLGFAHWLVSDENPLTARVTVNRHWQALFGQGLVRTPEDFGTQGEKPTHPQLLDWLAVEFRKTGWSMKRLHRMMVLSQTYRQSSKIPSQLLETDSQNRLLGRASRFRLEAEIVRDLLLSASGQLMRTIGGPSVFPPQPEGVTSLSYGRLSWKESRGADRYRRGLYTFAKRTTPYAAFSTFDAPSGETCVPRRVRSNTPLQALTLLNDSVSMESAKALAQRAMAEVDEAGGQKQAIAERMYRLCLTSPPGENTLSQLISFYQSQLQRFNSSELDAKRLLGIESGKPPQNLNEVAAWTTVARVLLNLDAMITRE